MSTRPLIFVFPGQSSRDPLMFDRLAKVDPGLAANALSNFSAQVGRSFDGAFASNLEIQVAVFEVTQAWLQLVHEAGLSEQASAGLSLGEYSHCVAIGALSSDAARNLVAARGRCYDAGPAGVMAAMFPLSLAELEVLCAQVCAELSDANAVAVANINSPTQNVIAGTSAAVDRVLALALDEFFINGQLIEHRIPMHVPLFAPVVDAFRPALAAAPWQIPTAEYWPNVDAKPLVGGQPVDFIDCLARHVWQPVRWRDTIDAMLVRYSDPVFVEIGPLQILARMMSRKWIDPQRVFAIDTSSGAEANDQSVKFCARIEAINHALVY
jgi:malonyl CoA-acyl carrier protein transacylase